MAARINRYAKVLKSNMRIYEIVEAENCPDMDPDESRHYQWVQVGPYAEEGQLVTTTGGIGDPPSTGGVNETETIPTPPTPPEESKLDQKIADMRDQGLTAADKSAAEGPPLAGSPEQPSPEPAGGSGNVYVPPTETPVRDEQAELEAARAKREEEEAARADEPVSETTPVRSE